MATSSSRLAFSLRAKLVLSYLGVALGAMLLLIIVVSLAVQNYFYTTQHDQLRVRAEYYAQQIGQLYHNNGESWDNVRQIHLYTPELFIVIDTAQQVRSTALPDFIRLSENDIPSLKSALQQALQGQETPGDLRGSPNDNGIFSGPYISVPLHDGGQANGALIGALLLAEPVQYPAGFSPYQFLVNVDKAILITGIALAVIVIIFSLWLAQRLTQPLTSLTLAAEQMKSGNYSQRVVAPKSQDELERLASTFNAMAEKIESDMSELRRQEQMRRDLIANIAHDLVTPLTAIQGFSEALADDVISDPEARHETAQLIGREVQRLRRLVSDMQQMSSLESGQIKLDLEPLDLHTLVDEVLAVIGPECEQAGITLYNKIAPTTPAVLADSDRLTQVLLNLLDNARRYTPEGGSITIGTRIEDRWLNVWVSDTGIGINANDLSHIFDRFFRIDRARTGTSGGSGLGLAIVKAIITAHGGSIRAESTPGRRTCITFTLPLATGLVREHGQMMSQQRIV